MGGVLALPVNFASAVLNKGIVYCLQYAAFYAYLTIKNIFRKKRFDLYNYEAIGQPERNSFLVPKEEWMLEPPTKITCLENTSDDVFIRGTNSKAEYLAVYVRRLPGNQVHCSLFIRLSDGKVYRLPEKHATQRATSEDNTFGSSRLKVQCLMPLRKWRVFFNGILEEQNQNQNSDSPNVYKHTKFSFIWTAAGDVFDFLNDLPKSTLSDIAAASSWMSSPTQFIKKLNESFNFYEQPGMILGTVTMENEAEKEIYLWGARQRFMGTNELSRIGSATEIYGNFRDGKQIHLVQHDLAGKEKKLYYGYIMDHRGFTWPIDTLSGDVEKRRGRKLNIRCLTNSNWLDISINTIGSNIKFQKAYGVDFELRAAEFTMDDREGRGFVLRGSELKTLGSSRKTENFQKNNTKEVPTTKSTSSNLCLPFENTLCRESTLTGGKGSSLAHLYSLSVLSSDNGADIKFYVPKGIVVSTAAYAEFIKGPLEKVLKEFEKDIWTNEGDYTSMCKNMVQVFGEARFPKDMSDSIVGSLKAVFGENISDYKFAVRSSATGEDTEQMSAAGQMETFLGVKGIDEILNAIKKCWASQFSFQAVEYKRGYGQLINTPMAVVIQEMVPCDVAGVIFTCDPVSGNPSFISITANYGLGESVVSASADPDTVTLVRNVDNKLKLHSKLVGGKKTKIVMDGEYGTKEIEIDDKDNSSLCLSDDISLKLGRISIAIENYYGTPRDIEWGIVGKDIFLFQSRPVTSLDMDTDFEIKHFFDSCQRTEKAFWSKANVGEVLPGATSPMSLHLLHVLFDLVYRRRINKLDHNMYPVKPYYQKLLTYGFSQVFFNLLAGQFRFGNQHEHETKGFMISLFGRLLPDDLGIIEEVELVPPPKISLFRIPLLITEHYFLSFFSGIILRRGSKKIEEFSIPCEKQMSSTEILQKIAHNFDATVEAMSLHMNCTMSSSSWNMSMLDLLAKARGDWDNVVFSDFAYLLSTCHGVESATIPSAIQDIGQSISKDIDPDEFKKMSIEEVLNWLKNTGTEAGLKFQEFLKRHGHRCLKEFDVYTETWESNPTPVIKMLQKYASKNPSESIVKETDSFSTVLSKLQVRLGFKERLRLRWLLPNSRRGVRERENAKSLYVLSNHSLRKPFHKLADAMVAEGRLPKKDLLFFLCVDEVQQLIRTRSPRIITRALRRYKIHNELDALKFPEICDGIPKPINENDYTQLSGKGLKMTGVPVSQGVVRAPARIVMNLEEAKSIQQGDVLITYSTDIGWSPYFPLLSGVVTELGGLISHGAVVAREYGLPCVVGLHGATRAFKSGDLVILDGNKGTLQKVDDE